MLKVQIQTVGVNLKDISKRQSTWGLIDWERGVKADILDLKFETFGYLIMWTINLLTQIKI